MSIYLDTNVFYNSYCPIEDKPGADWVLTQITDTFPAFTSEWTLIEMFRALKKQVNLENLEPSDAKIAIDFFLADVGQMEQDKKLLLVPATRVILITSRKQIFSNNLYAADALHYTTAIKSAVHYFITFDSDFKGDLESIPILNPEHSSFQQNILELKKKSDLHPR